MSSPATRQTYTQFAPLRTYNNRAITMTVAVKRVYDPPAASDGMRVLVDRLWPRGLSKIRAKVDEWFKDLAPSDELRKWFHEHPAEFEAFRKRYLKELAHSEAVDQLDVLHRLADENKRLSLLFAYSDRKHNNAVVLKDLLDGKRKPPTGTGPAAIGAVRQRRAARRPR